MHFYQHNIGDFAIETKYLTFEQKGIYVDLVDHYLASGKPLASEWLANIKRMASDGAVDSVLSLCFEKDGDVYRSKRLDLMLDEYEKRAEKNRENARKPRKKSEKSGEDVCSGNLLASSKPVASDSLTTNNQELLTINQELIKDKGSKKKVVLEKPEGVSPQVWDDFVALRKQKKAPLTETALKGIAREAQKAGITLEEALSTCCQRGWQGFNSEWILGKANGYATRPLSVEPDWSQIDYTKGLTQNEDGSFSF